MNDFLAAISLTNIVVKSQKIIRTNLSSKQCSMPARPCLPAGRSGGSRIRIESKRRRVNAGGKTPKLCIILLMGSLIDKVKSGDPQSVSEFYKSNSPKILNYLAHRLPSKEDAEDLTNDVFLEAIDSLQLLQRNSNLTAWLFKIAHNKMVDYYRKRKIKSILLSQIPYLEIIDKEVHQPEFQFEKNRIRVKIEKTLYALSEKYRKILRLHYEDNIPIKQIALEFNLSFKATESLLFRARRQFQILYERG
ncbi:MAG: sigma-70 family RNA polymerase sigma factor [Candidatus Levybacteria bacterium]|nr:sigma-70 family RNA polymerase sigma factor [Candidatus Levybacteria bacterium]